MRCVHHLSDIERKALLQLHHQTRQADVRIRCDMILLSDQGLSPPEIAQRALWSRRGVRPATASEARSTASGDPRGGAVDRSGEAGALLAGLAFLQLDNDQPE